MTGKRFKENNLIKRLEFNIYISKNDWHKDNYHDTIANRSSKIWITFLVDIEPITRRVFRFRGQTITKYLIITNCFWKVNQMDALEIRETKKTTVSVAQMKLLISKRMKMLGNTR